MLRRGTDAAKEERCCYHCWAEVLLMYVVDGTIGSGRCFKKMDGAATSGDGAAGRAVVLPMVLPSGGAAGEVAR
jgi:hypothetical protein